MAGVFPKLSSGSMFVLSDISNESMATYPLVIDPGWKTRNIRFLDDTEQSWTVRPPLLDVSIEYRGANGYDASILRNFFYQYRGKYVDPALTNTFSMTLEGTDWTNLVFDQDNLDVSVSSGETLTFRFRIKQLITQFVGGGPSFASNSQVVFHAIVDMINTTYAAIYSVALNGNRPGFYFNYDPTPMLDVSTTVSPLPSSLSGQAVNFAIEGTLGGTGLSTIKIREVYAVVTFPDGTTFTQRPRSTAFQPNGDGAVVVNPTNAMDGDTSTFATMTRSGFGPLLVPSQFFVIF